MPQILDQFGQPYESRDPRDAAAWGPGDQVRRWNESSDTDRLNSAHWGRASDSSINADLRDRLATLRTRSQYEAANNPIVEGMIRTHQVDVVGAFGPRLQVSVGKNPTPAEKRYADQLEEAWAIFWDKPDAFGPDINSQLGGPDLLGQWERMLWYCGEFLAQLTIDRTATSPVRRRIYSLHPRQLATPPSSAADASVVLGIKRSKTGKPLTYYVADSTDAGATLASDYRPIAARHILHRFEIQEPGQARGIPLLSTVLHVVADLRDYDAEVLDAARMAADFGVIMTATGPDSPYAAVNESVEMQRRRITHAPPGWAATMIDPKQPATQYIDYRKERHRDLGRPVGMPLSLVRLDHSDHNYSSARLDTQLYQRGVRSHQAWLGRTTLDPLVDLVAAEASFAGSAGASGPGAITEEKPAGRISYAWVWPTFPHVDPLKEAAAEKIRISNKTLSLTDAIAAYGKDLEPHLEQLQREALELKNKGLLGPEPTQAQRDHAAEIFDRAIMEYAAQLALEDGADVPTQDTDDHLAGALAGDNGRPRR